MKDEFDRKRKFETQQLLDKKTMETNVHPVPFNPNQNKMLLKYEYPF